ncbi:Veficolin-1 [Bulinus truncatus]|nr:Veficolin-1 [Bulinus truncatus]
MLHIVIKCIVLIVYYNGDITIGKLGYCTHELRTINAKQNKLHVKNINSCDNDRVVTRVDDGLQVMCDTKTDGGGWIIFQRRINGNVSFYRGWEEYKYGFGDYDVEEFYLDNEYIHQLTSKRHYEMRVDISGYSGNATDNFHSGHGYNNQTFSTFDNDNDDDDYDHASGIRGKLVVHEL